MMIWRGLDPKLLARILVAAADALESARDGRHAVAPKPAAAAAQSPAAARPAGGQAADRSPHGRRPGRLTKTPHHSL